MGESKLMNDYSTSVKRSMLEFIIEFLNWRRFIFKVTIAGTVIAIIIAFLIPKQYITFTSVRGAASTGQNLSSLLQSSLSSRFGGLANFVTPEGGGQVDYLIAIINSRTVQDAMIEKFGLRQRYGTEKIEDTREVLKSNTVIKRDLLAEIVSIGVYDEDAKTATDMSNYYVEMLNKIYTDVNSQAATNNRENLEMRYKQTERELSGLEDSLRIFQEKYGIYEITIQTEAAIKAAATLKAEILMKEVELGVKSKMLSQDSPELSQLKMGINQLDKAFREMIYGSNQQSSGTIFIPFAKTPSLGLAYLRLYRDVQIHSELLKVLIPLIEQSRLQEKRETPSLVVIDRAIVPEKKSKPMRMLIVFVGFVVSFIFGCLISLMIDYLARIKRNRPQEYEKVRLIYDILHSDLQFWRKR